MTRRGSIYLVVLGTVTIVALLGTAGVLAQTRQRARAGSSLESARAAALARSAIELGLQRVMEDQDWRTTPGAGVWYADAAPTGDARDGTLTLTVSGPDGGALGTGENDPFEFVAFGAFGDARRRASLAYNGGSADGHMDCLDVGAAIDGWADFQFNASAIGDAALSAHGQIWASSSTIAVDVEATGTISGTTYHGTTNTPAPTRTLPTNADVLAAYMALNPVEIARTDLIRSGSTYLLSDTVLAPGYNPFGARETHPQGLYVIDMANAMLGIENVRVHGTLIVVNPRIGSYISGSVSFEPAVPGYPSLIFPMRGVEFHTSMAPLEEANVGVNFNPAGAEFGPDADADTNDSYPSQMGGIVYVGQNVLFTTGAQMVFDGHLVVKGTLDLQIGAILQLQDNDASRQNPPPGFVVPGAGPLVMGQWAREFE